MSTEHITLHLEDGTEVEVPVEPSTKADILAQLEHDVVYQGEIIRVRMRSGFASIPTDRVMYLSYD